MQPTRITRPCCSTTSTHTRDRSQKTSPGKVGSQNQEGGGNINNSDGESLSEDHLTWRKKPQCIYRLSDSHSHSHGHKPSLFQQVCVERGWAEFSGGSESGRGSSVGSVCSSEEGVLSGREGGGARRGGAEEWNLWWRTTTMKSSWVRELSPWQLINHIPKARTFSRKDSLARYLRRMHRSHGPIYDFSPVSFNLPLEYTRLCSEHSRRTRILQYGDPTTCDEANLPFQLNKNFDLSPNPHNKENSHYGYLARDKNPIWICKPVGKSQGRGIHVFDKVAELVYDGSSVVQEYIVRPYLIGGYKWDLRIYACILSVSPLVIYAYREGLTRFATNKYDLDCLCNPFSHLTNSSLNKQSPQYKVNKEEIGSGCKWTLGRLRSYFQENGVADWILWQRIMSILVLTIVGEAHTLTSLDVGSKCFELLGFDILVDYNLKPTLLEVNTNPGLGNDCLVDEIVKRPMLHDLMTLLGLPDARQSLHSIENSNVSLQLGPNLNLKPPAVTQINGQIQNQNQGKHEAMTVREHPPTTKPTILKPSNYNPVPSGAMTSRQEKQAKQFKRSNSAHNPANLTATVATIAKMARKQKFQRQTSLDSNGSRSTSSIEFNPESSSFNYSQESWETDVKEVGGWVRIFPFDSQTQQNKIQMSMHDIKLAIARMHNYLKLVHRIGRKGKKEDDLNDMVAKHYGHLSTEPWHPLVYKNGRPTTQH